MIAFGLLTVAALATVTLALDNPLNQKVLRIASFHQAPDLFITKNSTQFSLDGPFKHVIHWLSLRLHFRFETVLVDESVNQSASNPQATALQYIKNQPDIDMLIPHVSLSHSRFLILDFSSITATVPTAFVRPALKAEEFIWTPVRIFPTTLWALIGLSGILVSICIYVVTPRNAQFSAEVVFVFSILLSQGELYRPSRYRRTLLYRLIMAAWCISALILCYAYTGNFISNLTKPNMKQYPPGSVELIEENWDMFYLVFKGGIGEEIIMSAKSGPLKKLGDALRKHPEYLVSDVKSAYKFVASGCCAFSHLMPFVKANVYEDYKATGKCRFSLGNTVSGYGYVGMVLQKSSPYTATVSLALLEMIEHGLLDHWAKPYADPPMPCLKKTHERSTSRVLRISDLKFPFVLLAIGCGVSLAAFVVELVYPGTLADWPLNRRAICRQGRVP